MRVMTDVYKFTMSGKGDAELPTDAVFLACSVFIDEVFQTTQIHRVAAKRVFLKDAKATVLEPFAEVVSPIW